MSALALSVLLSFVSALAYAGGAIVQEQVAVSCPDRSYLPLRRPGWWGALALNGLGGVLHVVALAYGPLSLVQPLGALTIVFALPMAALFVGRRAGAAAWRGAVMATLGLAVLLSLVGSSDTHALDAAHRVVVALVTGGAVAALTGAGRAVHRHPAVRSVLLATASGIAFGMSSVFTKTVAVDWTHGIDLDDLPSLAVIALFAVAGVLLSQASYRGGGLAAPLATLTVVNPVLAAAVGILMFGETFRYGSTGTVLALGCGVIAAGGLIMLTTERIGDPAEAVPTPVEPVPTPAETGPLAPPATEPAPAPAPAPAATAEPAVAPMPVVTAEPALVPARPAAPEPAVVPAPFAVPAPVSTARVTGAAPVPLPAPTALPASTAEPAPVTVAPSAAGPVAGLPQQRPAAESEAGQAAVRNLPAARPSGTGENPATGGPAAGVVLAVSYTPVPAGVPVLLPDLDRYVRQILTPPARR
ncbi:DMT family transporter [Streptomyces sp. NPDC051133]|uniref:DMT family transporter n=1 Tax=Streptomyces sp. NPDC051133 TaxID=3155521 RepID=UPI003442766A